MSKSVKRRNTKSKPVTSTGFGELPVTEVQHVSTVSAAAQSTTPSSTSAFLSDADCILFLPVPSMYLQGLKQQKPWESDQLFQYNPQLSEPAAFDPNEKEFFELDMSGGKPMAEDVKETHTSSTTATTLLKSLHTPAYWNSSTHRWCAHHCASFDGSPVYIPTRILPNGEMVMLPGVCFCSFECARAFIEDTAMFSTRTVTEYLTMLHLLKYKMTNDHSPIQRAPSRYLRDVFQETGQGCSLDTWKQCKTNYLFYPPLQPVQVMLETLIVPTHSPSMVLPSVKSGISS